MNMSKTIAFLWLVLISGCATSDVVGGIFATARSSQGVVAGLSVGAAILATTVWSAGRLSHVDGDAA
jgi:hypothetical protein